MTELTKGRVPHQRKSTPMTLDKQRERMLNTLRSKVDPVHAALLVIDMQNDFCAPGRMMDIQGLDLTGVQQMADRLPDLLEAARGARVPVVFVRNVYSTDADRYLSDTWLEQAQRRRKGSSVDRAVCGPDSWNGDFYSQLRPKADEPVVTKHRFSAFHDTDLELVLRTHGIRSVVLTGVATKCMGRNYRSRGLHSGLLRDLRFRRNSHLLGC
jgi:nicotinamidase-related amidase